MNKYTSTFIYGLILSFLLSILYWLSLKLAALDTAWNIYFWIPLFGIKIPFLGIALSAIFIYMLGAVQKTKSWIWIGKKVLSHIPIIGKFISFAITPRSREVLEKINGCVLAPFFVGGEYGTKEAFKPAIITAFFKTRYGYEVWLEYLSLPFPIGIPLEGTSIIKVFKKESAGKVSYSAIPTELAVRLELTGGTTVAEDALETLDRISLQDFLHSQNLI